IDAGRTVTLFRRIVEPIVDSDCLCRVPKAEVRRLVFLVVRVRNEHRGEPVKADLAIRSRVVDMPRGTRPSQLQMVGVVVECPRRGSPQHVSVERRIGETCPQAPAKAWPDIADTAQLLPHPAFFKRTPDFGPGLSGEPLKYDLGRDHAGFHRRVVALDLGYVDETGGTTDQRAAGKIEFRDRLKTALVQRACPIGYAAAAFKKWTDGRVGLEPLEFLKGVQKWVLVIQPDDKT